ncbi:hypothetical protein, partial [Pseudotabrizicola alkalilacus]|uniref:hypothetical protein n=1 Tax=Pseudotabrizicola alkalilacus TaxID=2305252 RepID=UPI001F1CB39E
TAFPHPLRFGKAVFRPTTKNLQEEIFTQPSFFSSTLCFLDPNAQTFCREHPARLTMPGRKPGLLLETAY